MKLREDKIAQGLTEIHEYLQGKRNDLRVTEIIDELDVKRIRNRVNLTQEEFAEKFGFPVSTIRNWEQGRRQPEGAARTLLKMISCKPDLVYQIMQENPMSERVEPSTPA
ncbi:MAG: helix-turn-helix domain-containing protein [Magnetococcus sp. YQC-5]